MDYSDWRPDTGGGSLLDDAAPIAVLVEAQMCALALTLAAGVIDGPRLLLWSALCQTAALAALAASRLAPARQRGVLAAPGAVLGGSAGAALIAGWAGAGFASLPAVAAIGGLIALTFVYRLNLIARVRQSADREARLQIEALQARMRPHFLFNSMNSISALIRMAPQQAEEAIADLADLFRASLQSGTVWVTVADELALCRSYLHIEQIRLGARLKLDWRVADSVLDARVPSLCLQPLIENAIYHGIERLAAGGTIRVAMSRERDMIRLTVVNPLASDAQDQHRGNRVAMANTRRRLELAFGPEAGLEQSQRAGEFIVRLHFPCRVT